MTGRLENIIGAFAFRVADAVNAVTQEKLDIAGPTAAAIALIEHDPGITIELLRKGLGLSHPGTVRVVNRLVAGGLVERRPSLQDRRAVELWLTADGVEAVLDIFDARRSTIATLLGGLSDSERDALEGIVEKLLSTTVNDLAHAYAICRLCESASCADCPVESGLKRRAQQEQINEEPSYGDDHSC